MGRLVWLNSLMAEFKKSMYCIKQISLGNRLFSILLQGSVSKQSLFSFFIDWSSCKVSQKTYLTTVSKYLFRLDSDFGCFQIPLYDYTRLKYWRLPSNWNSSHHHNSQYLGNESFWKAQTFLGLMKPLLKWSPPSGPSINYTQFSKHESPKLLVKSENSLASKFKLLSTF